MQIYNPTKIGKIIWLFVFIMSITNSLSQENPEIKKIKCLKKMPVSYEQIKNNDTLFILYHKSTEKGFEQNKIDIKNYDGNSYYFYNYIHFPLEIYDYEGFEKVNFRNPIVMYKTKSFIRKRLKNTIDVYFLKKFSYEFYTDFYDKKRVTFVIDLDSKIKNKYKIVQVNNPIRIIE